MLKLIALAAILPLGALVFALDLAPAALSAPSPYLLMAASLVMWGGVGMLGPRRRRRN